MPVYHRQPANFEDLIMSTVPFFTLNTGAKMPAVGAYDFAMA